MKLIPLCLALGALTSSCNRDGVDAADNTSKNARDKSGDTVTPIDQSNSEGDLSITRDVRKAIMDADLSVNAENCKVVTTSGRVTLRGVVANEQERTKIVAIAETVPGVLTVDDQLEVKAN